MVVAPSGEAVVAEISQPRCQRKFYAPIDAGMIDSLKIDVLHAGPLSLLRFSVRAIIPD